MSNTTAHTHARPLTDDTFAAAVEQASGVVMVDFGASWCAPCRMIAPAVEQLAAEYAGRAAVATVDVDANPRVAARYNVRSLPTLLFFRDGKVVDTLVGAAPKGRIAERLDKALAAA
jgi:thioredoxin 1